MTPRVAELGTNIRRKRPERTGAAPFIPETSSLPLLAASAQACRGCELYRRDSQTVFGRGPSNARVMLLGEQPGDQEDLQGLPFVGPAGRILQRALLEAGIPSDNVYVTNAVKHFNWKPAPRGKRRLHSKPKAIHFQACLPWLEKELEVIEPDVLVMLGTSAAQALLGSGFRVTQARGQAIRGTPWAPTIVATVHPSSILRAPTDVDRREAFAAFVDDLKKVAALMTAEGSRNGL